MLRPLFIFKILGCRATGGGDKKGRNKSGQVLGVRDYISEQLVQIFQGINFFDLLGERDPELFVISQTNSTYHTFWDNNKTTIHKLYFYFLNNNLSS